MKSGIEGLRFIKIMSVARGMGAARMTAEIEANKNSPGTFGNVG